MPAKKDNLFDDLTDPAADDVGTIDIGEVEVGEVLDKPEPKKRQARKKPKTWGDVADGVLPVNAQSGNLNGVVKRYAGRTIAEISIEHWVGVAPLSILAEELDDLEKVIKELRKPLA